MAMHVARPGPRIGRSIAALIVLLPLVAGLGGTLLPSAGLFPGLPGAGSAADLAGPGLLAAWDALLRWPGLGASLMLTVSAGVLATGLSTVTALALAAAARRAVVLACVQPAAAVMLAVPHAAMAAGLAFLIAPSGWLVRLVSPWLTGWHTPPDLAVVHDPSGLAMVAGLWLKETPFLLLAALAALGQVRPEASLRAAAALGHGPWRAWCFVLLPRVWRQIRLPVLAVLVFSLSVVDVALILGPGEPPPLAVQLLRWFDDPDLGRWPVACAGALLLAGVAAACCGVVLLLERLAARLGRSMLRAGLATPVGRGLPADAAALSVALAMALTVTGALGATLLWAGAASWRFPDAWPDRWSAALLGDRWDGLSGPALATLGIAPAAAALSVIAAVLVLEPGGGSAAQGRRRPPAWVYAPLLVPQPALLWGQQILLVRAGLDGTWLALVWSHAQFVLPYVLLVLADPFRAVDPRYGRAAASLGVGPWRVFRRVTLPLLVRPMLAAAAVGFAVSVGLYLPTLFAGAGRVDTLATVTVTLSSGPDRRLAAAAALAQAALPCVGFAVAILLPSWAARHRRGLALAR